MLRPLNLHGNTHEYVILQPLYLHANTHMYIILSPVVLHAITSTYIILQRKNRALYLHAITYMHIIFWPLHLHAITSTCILCTYLTLTDGVRQGLLSFGFLGHVRFFLRGERRANRRNEKGLHLLP